MGGSSKKQTVGYKYSLGAHMGICHGPIDNITRIRVSDRTAWEGESTGGAIFVDNEDLFGGPEREGGIYGTVDFEFGATDQTVNTYLNSIQPVAAESIPAYRGICAAVLNQVYLGTNPYLKPWEFRAQRIHTSTRGELQWYDEKAEILNTDSVNNILFTEDFESGLGLYTFDGADALTTYTLVADDFGNCLNVDNLSSAVLNRITYLGIPVQAKICTIKFKITSINPGDCCRFDLLDESDNFIFRFIPVRSSLFDSSRRATFITNTSTEYNIGTSQLDIGVWYEASIQITETTFDVSVTNLSTEIIVDSFSINEIPTSDIFNYRFRLIAAPASDASDVRYDDIVFSGYIASGDMNPAHIIRECITDNNWGMGYTDSDIDDTSFADAADTLFSEEFGMSLLWSQDDKIEEFIQDVLRHIDGLLYINPRTGKFTLKLIRDDYIAASLPILDESNIISINDYEKPTIGELTNYVTVKYWDRSTSQNASISVQDIALAQQQGSVVPASVTFPGITNGTLASRVASRTLRALSNPIIACSIIADRSASSLNIGDAFKLSWAKFGLTETIMRVTNISFGTMTNGQVKIDCIQDVFALPQATFSSPTDSGFTTPTNAPANSPYRLVEEVNYWTLIQDQGEDFTFNELDGWLLTAAVRPSSDALNYRVWTDESGSYQEKESADFCPTATITSDFPKATSGVVNVTIGLSGLDADDVADIDIGSPCQIGNEIMSVVSLTTTEGTFGRAVIDSPIEDHVSGDRIFFWGNSFYGGSTELYQDSDTIGVKITPSTAQGQLDVADATAESLTFDQRAYRAWLPGNVKLNSVYFPDYIENTSTVDSTWAHRDRTLQTAGLVDFDEASIGPEVGTTYTTTLIRVNDSVVLDTNTGLTGTTDSLDTTGYDGLVRYEIKSIRDSLDSYFTHTHELPVTRTSFILTEQGDFILTEDGEYLVTES